MTWIFLSPHLDDAIYSCGGLIFDRTQAGETVEIWSVFTADPIPPFSEFARELHDRWQVQADASQVRRAEDIQAAITVGARTKHFNLPDVIYRRDPVSGEPVVRVNEDLFAPLPDFEQPLQGQIARFLKDLLNPVHQVVCPLGLGNHVDHVIVRAAAESLARPLFYYADFPYVFRDRLDAASHLPAGASESPFPVSTAALKVWYQAVLAYRSQVSTFWESEGAAVQAVQQYWQEGGGQCLWRST